MHYIEVHYKNYDEYGYEDAALDASLEQCHEATNSCAFDGQFDE
jgi:hypothetical protein